MKRAWKMVKNMGMTISEGLKKAWREAKMKKELIGTPKQVAWAQDIIDDAMNTINANIRIDYIFCITFRNSINRTFCCTSTTADTVIINKICHIKNLL